MSIKLLIVDDNPMMRGFLERLLTKDSAIGEIRQAENGKNGIDVAKVFSPDVMLMDIEMPIMDGFEALKEIKSLQRSGEINNKMKVIILSGTMFNNDANVRKAKFLGAYGVLAKPDGKSMSFSIESSKLLDTIKEAGK